MPSQPLAGRPPYATDEPDTFYSTSPSTSSGAPRQQMTRFNIPSPQEERTNANKRTSAYDLYDNYLSSSGPSSSNANNRNSGIGALLMSMDDDSDSDDDDDARSPPTKPPGTPQQPSTPLSKNAALAAAVSSPNAHRHNPFANTNAPPPQQQQQQRQQPGQSRDPFENPPMQQQGPMVLAAPQPGYAAPIAALNLGKLAASAGTPQLHSNGPSMPQPAMMRQPAPNMPMPAPIQAGRGRPPPNLQIKTSNPFELEHPPLSPFVMSNGRVATPSPHPLQPPITPITPAFIRPAKSIPAPAAISFDEAGLRREKQGSFDEERKAVPRKRIMRGDGEETLLPKRGERGDDFWRRFSMVVKDSKGGKVDSPWLNETLTNTSRYTRWVWAVGMFLLIVIGAAIGCGVYFTRNSPGHQQPKVFGGAGDNVATEVSTTSGAKTTSGKTVLHVSPTNTVERRWAAWAGSDSEDGWEVNFPTPTPTPTPTPAVVHVKFPVPTGNGNGSASSSGLSSGPDSGSGKRRRHVGMGMKSRLVEEGLF